MFVDSVNELANICALSPEEVFAALLKLGYETDSNPKRKKCPPDYNPGFCYPDYDCDACWKGWLKENENN